MIAHTQEAREALMRYAVRRNENGVVPEEPLGITENNDTSAARSPAQVIGRRGIHPLELNTGTLLFSALNAFFGGNEDNTDPSYHHGFW